MIRRISQTFPASSKCSVRSGDRTTGGKNRDPNGSPCSRDGWQLPEENPTNRARFKTHSTRHTRRFYFFGDVGKRRRNLKRRCALPAVVSITRRPRVAEPILFSDFPAADGSRGGNGGSSESQGRDRRRAACGEPTRGRHWNRPCCLGRSIDLNTSITATIALRAKKETEAGKPDVQDATG